MLNNILGFREEDAMSSKKIGRRRFIKGASSTVLGLAAFPFGNVNLSFANTEKAVTPQYLTLGKTGLKVTAVSMGAGKCSEPTVLHHAFNLGVNFYDTANSYMAGRNEEMVGKVFRRRREKVLIQTKINFQSAEREDRRSVETSLRRLRTDYVDVLLAHSLKTPGEVSDPALVEFLQTMKKEGKARFTGFSSHTDMAALLREAAKDNVHDVALVSYNFTCSNELKEAVASAAKSGIGIVAMKTQAGGYKAKDMGGLSPHQAALKYVLMDQHVTAAVLGVTTIEQLEECAAVMGTALSEKDLDALKLYQSHLQGRICTMCGGCIGQCPRGVAHGDLLRAIMYHDGYKDDKLAKAVLRTRGALHKISQCSECSSCAVTCRRGLNIHAQLKAVHRMFG
jgi:predicted aldo/keto reductase-like oxidoreductase